MSILLEAAVVAVNGVVIVLIITASGIILTNLKVLNLVAGEILSKLSVALLLPCLLFCEIASNLTLDDFKDFLVIFVYCSLHILIGYGLGYFLSRLIGATPQIQSLMMVTIGFQDTTAIPLIYASVLGNSSISNMESDFADIATEYVLIYSVFIIIFKWTIAFKTLEKEGHRVSYAIPESFDQEREIEDDHSFRSYSEVNKNDNYFRRFATKLKTIMNPPIYASLIAIPFALVPYMKEYVLVGSGSVLGKNVFAAFRVIGKTASPIIDIVLGINLSKGCPENADISWLQLILILLGKLVFMPIIGFGLIELAYETGLINRILAIMLLIIYCGPTSLQLLMVCIIHENNVENISKVYYTMYVVAIFPLTIWTTMFLIYYY